MRLLLALPLLLLASPVAAQQRAATREPTPEEDAQAVLATLDSLFAAIEAKDPAAFTEFTLLEGSATAAYETSTGMPMLVSSDWSEFAQRLPQIPGKPQERNINPQVRIDGDIAMVWTPYVFTIDGKLSHCGTNHFDLVRKNGQWRVLNATWTQRKTGCPVK